jgi:hypothetical protein
VSEEQPQEEQPLFKPAPPAEVAKYPERYCCVCGAKLEQAHWAQRGLPGICDKDAAAHQARL